MAQKTGPKEAGATKQLPEFSRIRCKQCGICAGFCPKGAIGIKEDGNPYLKDPDACTGCSLCEHLCPDFGVRLSTNGKRDAGTDTKS
jgi:2-oxoglutarate ferredoxin oxidoreductase subunit delta